MTIRSLDRKGLETACRELAGQDERFGRVLGLYGMPPLWDRPVGFGTLLRIILEQQVSLASARACFEKLESHIGEVVPERVIELDDVRMREIGFSRQKTAYARHLCVALMEQRLDLIALEQKPDAEARAELMKLKGVGEWTSDIYLLMALLRPDVMPRGDIALHAAFQELDGRDSRPGSDEFVEIAEKWTPYRSAAARMLWHFYLSEKAGRTSQKSEK